MNSDSSEIERLNSSADDIPSPLPEKSSGIGGVEFVSEVRRGHPFVAQIAGGETPAVEADQGQHVQPLTPMTAALVRPPSSSAQLPSELSNIAAIGGAVGAVVLGGWSILCSLITPFSAINALLAILMGAYGLMSRKKKLATLGILLGVIGLAMSLIETNELISNYFAEEAAN